MRAASGLVGSADGGVDHSKGTAIVRRSVVLATGTILPEALLDIVMAYVPGRTTLRSHALIRDPRSRAWKQLPTGAYIGKYSTRDRERECYIILSCPGWWDDRDKKSVRRYSRGNATHDAWLGEFEVVGFSDASIEVSITCVAEFCPQAFLDVCQPELEKTQQWHREYDEREKKDRELRKLVKEQDERARAYDKVDEAVEKGREDEDDEDGGGSGDDDDDGHEHADGNTAPQSRRRRLFFTISRRWRIVAVWKVVKQECAIAATLVDEIDNILATASWSL
jgi:hypothetical protein